MAKARSTTTGASVRARAAAKPRSAKATARPVSKSAVKPHKRHRLLGFLATMFALLALAGTAARALPADLQELPFVPIVVSATPWFTLLGLIALLLAIVSRRILAALIAIAAIACNGYWQYPFFYSTDPLPQAAQNAVAAASPNTSDAYARVMTFNVYKGQADPQAIVELVRDQRVEVLALQETTEDFRAMQGGQSRGLRSCGVVGDCGGWVIPRNRTRNRGECDRTGRASAGLRLRAGPTGRSRLPEYSKPS